VNLPKAAIIRGSLSRSPYGKPVQTSVRQVVGRRDFQRYRAGRGFQGCALIARCHEALAAHRIRGASGDEPAAFLCVDRAAEDRQPVCVVGGAVERIDDEADLAVALRPALLREDPRSRCALVKDPQHRLFGRLVGIGDQVEAALKWTSRGRSYRSRKTFAPASAAATQMSRSSAAFMR
jgi:hypothetical protein